MEKERLDLAMVRRGLVDTRSRAKQLIEDGWVQLNGRYVMKSGIKVKKEDKIVILEEVQYVSRGGKKLESALHAFHIDVRGLLVLDVGASTGGFTDCLLRYGASRVYAVDVGHGQLAPKLINHPQVQYFEGTDIRKLDSLPELVDLAVVDVSFISLRLVLPSVKKFLKPDSLRVIALVKPQFEAGHRRFLKKGMIKDSSLRNKIVQDWLEWVRQQQWKVMGMIQSPVLGGEGTVEYLVYIELGRNKDL